ncbi:MAG: hypothetical protein EOO65_02565 [Methanosarcinales archaeon]|nr:MAG: hypothetical protein EOO65_02565 [Methanosarcinales archaeon]
MNLPPPALSSVLLLPDAARLFISIPRTPVGRMFAAKADVPMVDKQKFLVPGDLTVGQFVYVIRKRLALPPEKALFVFVGNTLPTTGSLLREVYAQFADEDGFLYVVYASESTFGAE